MSKKRTIQRGKQLVSANGNTNTHAPIHAAFVITIAFDPQSGSVNYNVIQQGNGSVFVEDQILAIRTTYEAFVGYLAVEAHKKVVTSSVARGE